MSILGSVFSAILGGISSSSKNKQQTANTNLEGEWNIKTAKEGGYQDRESYAFKSALDDYYAKKNRAEKTRALGNYTQFSSLDNFAPGYKNKFTPDTATMPTNTRGY